MAGFKATSSRSNGKKVKAREEIPASNNCDDSMSLRRYLFSGGAMFWAPLVRTTFQ